MASEPGIQASWLAVEGNFYPEGEDQKPVDFPKQSNITPALAKYYQAVTTIILGDSHDLFRVWTFFKIQLLVFFFTKMKDVFCR